MTDSLRPIVLIGAARSGTKILRDALAVALGRAAGPLRRGIRLALRQRVGVPTTHCPRPTYDPGRGGSPTAS